MIDIVKLLISAILMLYALDYISDIHDPLPLGKLRLDPDQGLGPGLGPGLGQDPGPGLGRPPGLGHVPEVVAGCFLNM